MPCRPSVIAVILTEKHAKRRIPVTEPGQIPAFLGILLFLYVGASLGFSLAIFLSHEDEPMTRGRFLFVLGATGLINALGCRPLLEVLADKHPSAALGILSMALAFPVALGTGWMQGVAARMRSMDAYGHTGQAWLALLPPFNLFLILKKGSRDRDDVGAVPWLKYTRGGYLGAALGAGLYIASYYAAGSIGALPFEDAVAGQVSPGLVEQLDDINKYGFNQGFYPGYSNDPNKQ